MRLRIIGGNFKGKRLQPVQGKQIRPTADRLRESIFDIISSHVVGTSVLDLFAGTGALGIEALSRGAEHAVLIDDDKTALSIIRKNIQSCALDKQTKIIQWDITKNLYCIRSITPSFDLVLMDPPYNKNTIKITLFNLHQSLSLKKGAKIFVEHRFSEPVPERQWMYQMTDQRKYGKTLVSILNYVP